MTKVQIVSEILKAYAQAKMVPTPPTQEFLAKTAGVFVNAIQSEHQRYAKEFDEHGDDAFTPIAPMMG